MKRVLAFLLLLALGFVALQFATGNEGTAGANGGAGNGAANGASSGAGNGAGSGANGKPVPPKPEPQQRPVDTGDAIKLDKKGSEIQVRGGFTTSRMREIPREDGGTVRQKVYELDCRDSMPVAEGKHRLEDVVVKLFDDGKHVADLTARRAVVELQVDERQQRSLRENRELELEDAMLATIPGGSLPNVRFQVRLLLARLDTDSVTLETPDRAEPVTVVVDGDEGGELRGLGLLGRIPRDRAQKDGKLELTIHSDPIVVMQGVRLKAKGSMHYVEHLQSGAARLDLDREVEAELLAKQSRDDGLGKSLSVVGDRLHGYLQRTPRSRSDTGERDRGTMTWTALRLHGAPAKVTTDTVVLNSPRLTVLPGQKGQLAAITADGGDSRLQQLGANGATFRSKFPIHLVRTATAIGELHRAYGFQAAGLGALNQLEIVTFEGAAEVDAGDGVSVAADRGMTLFRPQIASFGGALVAIGRGNVTVAQGTGNERVEAHGDAGFRLVRNADGDVLELGADDPAAKQTFELMHGDLDLRGRGAARLERAAGGRVHVVLRSNEPALKGVYGRRGTDLFGELRAAETIEAVVDARGITNFAANGRDLEIEVTHRGQPVTAHARRIEQVSAATWRLTGPADAPARLVVDDPQHGVDGTLTGPRIDLHRVAERSLLIEAFAKEGARANLRADVPASDGSIAKGAARAQIVADADCIRMLPFAAGPASTLQRGLGLPNGVAEIAVGNALQPWLLANGAVAAELTEPTGERVQLRCTSLATSFGARSMLLSGSARTGELATLHRVEKDQRVLTAEGPRIRFAQEKTEHITMLTTFADSSTMVPPSVSFRGATNHEGSKLGWLRGECHGEIEVLRETVAFHGPVEAKSLTERGEPDPRGLQVEAQRLVMRRHRETGKLLAIDADGGVTVHWRDLFAQSRHVELDLSWERCIAEDENGAEVRFGNGLRYVARRVEANYATYTVRSYFGSLSQTTENAAR